MRLKFHADLYGFESVATYANNGTIANVALELPQKDKPDESRLSPTGTMPAS